MTSLVIARKESGAFPLVNLSGRLTLGEGSRALRRVLEEIAAEGHRHVLLDLREVSYVDSSGLGTLVAGYNSVKPKQGSIALLRVPPRVMGLLELSGLTAIFRVFETEEEAAKHLSGV